MHFIPLALLSALLFAACFGAETETSITSAVPTATVVVAAAPVPAAMPAAIPIEEPIRPHLDVENFQDFSGWDCTHLAKWAGGEVLPYGFGDIPWSHFIRRSEVAVIAEFSRSKDHLYCRVWFAAGRIKTRDAVVFKVYNRTHKHNKLSLPLSTHHVFYSMEGPTIDCDGRAWLEEEKQGIVAFLECYDLHKTWLQGSTIRSVGQFGPWPRQVESPTPTP